MATTTTHSDMLNENVYSHIKNGPKKPAQKKKKKLLGS